MTKFLMPRVKMTTGEAVAGEFKGRWSWKIELYLLNQYQLPHVIKTIEGIYLEKPHTFVDEAAAHKDGEAFAEKVVQILQRGYGGTGREGMIDLKNGLVRVKGQL